MCTVIGSRQILNKRPHERGPAHLRGVHVSSVASPRQDAESRSPRSEKLRLTGRAEVGSVGRGSCPILKALVKVVRVDTLSHSLSPLQVQDRPTLTPSQSWLCTMPAWPARLAAAAALTPILRLTSAGQAASHYYYYVTRTVLGATSLSGA